MKGHYKLAAVKETLTLVLSGLFAVGILAFFCFVVFVQRAGHKTVTDLS